MQKLHGLWSRGLPILILVAVTFAVYANSLPNRLVYDDHFLIEGNWQVRDGDLRGIFTTHYWGGYEGNETGQYRPLVILSFAVNHALHGLRPFGYHLTNVLLHVLNSVLVYLLAIRVLGDRPSPRQAAPTPPLPYTGEGKSSGARRGEGCDSGLVALAAGLLFAVHPVHAEAAAGVTFGRADLLAALFTFGSLLFYTNTVTGHRSRVTSPKSDLRPAIQDSRLILSLLCFVLALLSKESAVALIGLLGLYDVAGAEETQFWRAFTGTLRRRWRAYALYVLVFVAYLSLRAALGIGFSAGSLSRLNNPLFGAPILHRLWTAAKLLSLYAGLALAPLRLSVDYSYNAIPVAVSLFEPSALAGAGVAALGLLLWGWAFRRARGAFFAIGVFLICYAPVSQAGTLINALFQERFLYVPLLGFCLLAGLLLRRIRGIVAVAVVATVVVLYAARTVVRNRDWRDDQTLFASAVEACPNSVKAQSLLGDVLAERGSLDGAVARYREAIRLASPILPDVANVYNNLGNVYQLQGRLDEALDAYRRAVTLQPDYAAALKSSGVVSLKKGDAPGAAIWFEKVVALRPEDAEAHYNLGFASRSAGRMEEAIRHYERAVALRPDYAEAYYNLGNAYGERGRTGEAIRAYRKFVEVWRGDAQMKGMAEREIEALEKR
ncbi:MAG: tetratricopeptide repeat protein [Candidatus Latescibacteria bacterium]|nr:tetratricopeptide repeat protein [Candidatus Latescibacterota bacterium]